MCRAAATILAAAALVLSTAVSVAANRPCGLSPSDWCAAPPGNSCGRHSNERSCRADPACAGMPYRGESVIACLPDGRGFWSNCPAVGCVSRRAVEPRGR